MLLLLGGQGPGGDHLRQVDVRARLAPGGPVVLLVEVLEDSLGRKEVELSHEPALLFILTGRYKMHTSSRIDRAKVIRVIAIVRAHQSAGATGASYLTPVFDGRFDGRLGSSRPTVQHLHRTGNGVD